MKGAVAEILYVILWPKGYVVFALITTVLEPSGPRPVDALEGMRKTCARPPSSVDTKEFARNLG